MIEYRTPTEIEQMRPAGAFVAGVLTALKEKAAVGVNLLELDALAHQMIRDARRGVLLHRLPPVVRGQPVRQGPLHLRQRRGAARTPARLRARRRRPAQRRLRRVGRRLGRRLGPVGRGRGTQRQEDLKLIETTEVALAAGIAAAQPGAKIGDISFAIARVATQAGYKINTDFGGHGVGRTMHGDPHIPNDGRRGAGSRSSRVW